MALGCSGLRDSNWGPFAGVIGCVYIMVALSKHFLGQTSKLETGTTTIIDNNLGLQYAYLASTRASQICRQGPRTCSRYSY